MANITMIIGLISLHTRRKSEMACGWKEIMFFEEVRKKLNSSIYTKMTHYPKQ